MKRDVLIIGVLLILLVSACAPQAAPTANSLDVQHTAEAGAFTMVAQTQAAVPTVTPVPATETSLPTALPTDTPPPCLPQVRKQCSQLAYPLLHRNHRTLP